MIFQRFSNPLQKTTRKDITEGFKPIKEGVENLPQTITFPTVPPIQTLEKSSGEEEATYIGEKAKEYLDKPNPDTTYGLYKIEGLHYICGKQATIADNNIMVDDEKYKGMPGLWVLTVSKLPVDRIYTYGNYINYAKLMLKTNTLHRDNDPKDKYPKSSRSEKWVKK